ncbi:hypothetical protein DFP72DRAFT_841250 [Ephemerocybe angulata]|uniref:Uncharacterized protein n=1 Tax=Ephemerocybe angulata TaxID=980116 RepID=A0A8H6MG38_9AGAR|nr:hypothetical protein DFP72DRAFT_841250 [Tulosesus angulatus]
MSKLHYSRLTSPDESHLCARHSIGTLSPIDDDSITYILLDLGLLARKTQIRGDDEFNQEAQLGLQSAGRAPKFLQGARSDALTWPLMSRRHTILLRGDRLIQRCFRTTGLRAPELEGFKKFPSVLYLVWRESPRCFWWWCKSGSTLGLSLCLDTSAINGLGPMPLEAQGDQREPSSLLTQHVVIAIQSTWKCIASRAKERAGDPPQCMFSRIFDLPRPQARKFWPVPAYICTEVQTIHLLSADFTGNLTGYSDYSRKICETKMGIRRCKESLFRRPVDSRESKKDAVEETYGTKVPIWLLVCDGPFGSADGTGSSAAFAASVVLEQAGLRWSVDISVKTGHPYPSFGIRDPESRNPVYEYPLPWQQNFSVEKGYAAETFYFAPSKNEHA